MLEDRDYMRQPDYRESRISFTVALLIFNAVIFVAQLLVGRFVPNGLEIENSYFALSLYGLAHGRVWELLTFQFMHGGLMHILLNSLAIYFFGRPVETVLGGAKFLTLYFVSGVIGGLVQMLFTILPVYADVPVVGASAGASGLVAAFAVLNWEQPFTLILYFIPITMRGKTLLWVSLALAVVGMMIDDGIANAAHLGGILTGFFYARHFIHGNWPSPNQNRGAFLEFLGRRKKSPRQNENDLSAEEFLRKEVDPILEKISAHGIQSLTAREREILEKARSKMGKR
jgi:membrane associated rhomboid family serine protease